ncbi:MAG: GNAT family N-acetyltransferase [Hyphomicrobiaceae bacterium]|nr:GNAT family N-acetyltransferase [Hyphomicrobiaceae bacterium]
MKREHVTEDRLADYLPLMQQLRPHLASLEDFAQRFRRMSAGGYRLIGFSEDGALVALAGVRVMETLIHGRFLYVDDLVTTQAARRGGVGARVMDDLKAEARALDCAKLVLDTALDNVLAHRFYYRQGLVAAALRFNVTFR